MICPYYGDSCSCRDECQLDVRKRDPISGRLMIVLGSFNCECGADIETPVTPCDTAGCVHRRRKKPIFQKIQKIGDATVKTIELPLSGYQTNVIGGKLNGEVWTNETLREALLEHDNAVLMIEVLS